MDSHGGLGEIKEYEVNLARSVRIILSIPLSMEIKILLSSGYRAGTSHMRVLEPVSREKRGRKSK